MTAIPGATSSTYTLVSADIGQNITCTVTATNSAGNASATSAALGPVTGPPIVLTAAVGIFPFAGEDMVPVTGYALAAAVGTFPFAGQNATLVPPVATFTLSGNVKSGAFAYWSTARAYNTAAASGLLPVMDLVDQAGANQTTISLLANGRVNVAAINTWVTANSVTTIKVKQLYDQTGNGRHVSQATLANMPVLKLAHPGLGNNTAVPVMDFTMAANMSLTSGATGLSTTTGTFSFIARVGSIDQMTSAGFLGIIQAGGNGPAFYGQFHQLCMYNGSVATYTGALSDNFHSIQSVFNGASSFLVVNGVASPSLDAGTGTLGSPFVIGKLVNGNPLGGNISEIRFDNAIWTPTDCSNEYASQKTFWFNNPAYEGIVASRCRRREAPFDSTNKYMNSRSAHIASQTITALRVLFGNMGSGPLVTTASVEYPAGTFNQIKFLGASSISIPSAVEYLSDYTTVSIPNGATFWIRQFSNGTAATGVTYNTWQNSFLGEAVELSVTALTDKTMSGTITNAGSPSGVSAPPTLIVGVTTQPTAIVVGDSIGVGYFDVEDTSNTATGYNNVWGYVTKSLNAMGIPFANYAVTTTQAANRAPSLAMGKCSHLVSEFGINDFDIGGASSATLITSIGNFAKFTAPYAKLYQSTVLPHTTSANGFIAPQDQVTNNATTDTNRVLFNNALRAGTTGIVRLTNFINSASVAESAVNSNKWTVAGSPPYVTDGLHPNVAGHNLMTGTIPPMTWP